MNTILYEGIVPEGQKPVRLDQYITAKYPKYSRSKTQKAILESRLLVNGLIPKANYLVKTNDQVQLMSKYSNEGKIHATQIPLDIIYEDNELLVVNKSSGMAVHAGLGTHTDTLLNAIAHHYKITGQEKNLPNGLVHRLDKGSSGLICVAKTKTSFQYLANQFKKKEAGRTYNALVWGITPAQGLINLPIGRNPDNKMQIMVDKTGLWGKTAITKYTTLQKLPYCSLIECKLETGRTHQIRVHMHYLGYPLLGDKRYPAKDLPQILSERMEQLGISFQLLHATKLEIIHPNTLQKLTFESHLPVHFSDLITYLKNE